MSSANSFCIAKIVRAGLKPSQAFVLSSCMVFNTAYAEQEKQKTKDDAGVLDTIVVEAKEETDIIKNNIERVAPGGKTNVTIAETPFSISVVDEGFMEDTGAKNIEDALSYTSGVYAGQFGFDTRGDWTNVRGLDAANYLDGLRSIYGFYNSVRTNTYTLDSIEVLKGPSSVLYGQSDLGGIINAVSKLPEETASGEIWFQTGSFDRNQIATDLTGPMNSDGTFLYRLVALTRESGTQVDFVDDDAYVFMPSVTWKPNDRTSLTFLVNKQETTGQVSAQFLPSKGTIDPAPLGQIATNRFVGEPGWDRYDRKKTEISILFDQQLSENWSLSSIFRKTDSEAQTREHWITVGAVPDDSGNVARTIYTVDRKTDIFNFDIRLEGEFTTGSALHRFVAGIDRQDAFWEEYNYFYGFGLGGTFNLYNPVYGNLNDGIINPTDRDDNEIKQLGIYLIDNIEIGNTIISAALRHDDTDNKTISATTDDTVSSDSEVTGRLGVMYQFESGLSPYISYSEAFSPNLGTDGAGGTLAPTVGSQRELGVKYLSPNKKTMVNFAHFDIDQKNRVSQGATPGGVEQVGALIDGWELEVKHRWQRLQLLFNYTLLDAKQGSENGPRLPYVAEKIASAWGKYEFTNGFRVGLGTRYNGSNVGFGGSPEVPSVGLYDAMLGYEFENWDFSVNVENLTDEVYISWCRSAGRDCGFGERRTVNANVRYSF